MTVKRIDSGEWFADIRPKRGWRERYRKSFPTKAEALRWETWVKANKTQRPDWAPPPRIASLSELVDKCYQSHGQHLRDGENRLLMIPNMQPVEESQGDRDGCVFLHIATRTCPTSVPRDSIQKPP